MLVPEEVVIGSNLKDTYCGACKGCLIHGDHRPCHTACIAVKGILLIVEELPSQAITGRPENPDFK